MGDTTQDAASLEDAVQRTIVHLQLAWVGLVEALVELPELSREGQGEPIVILAQGLSPHPDRPS